MRFIRTVENLFGLPLGFTRVEYLQSSGTQYIDTGVIGNGEFDVDYIYYQTQDTANAIFAGTRSSSQHLNFGQRSNGSSGGFSMAYLGEYWQAISSPAINTKIRVQISYKSGSQTGYLNGVAMTGKTLVGTEETNLSIYLFKRNHYGTDNVSGLVGRIYYFKLWKDGALVRDFIPCIDPLGVACMYDLVGKKPYYNQGTGTFTVGRQVIPVEYLESTGTQYIDTGVGGYLTTELTCEAAIVQAGNASVTNIMGNNVTNTRAITINMSANVANPSPSRIRFGDTDTTTEAGAIDLNTFYKYDTNKNGLTVRDVSGTVLNTYALNATTAFTTNGNILIFKLGDTSTQYIGKIKVKGATIKNSGVLVRDFIPCKDENNVGYMFDKVSGTCYLNAGTGDFSVGEPVYTSKLRLIKDAKELPDGYKRVDYLESVGGQLIDTGYNINTATDEVICNFQLTSTTLYQWLMGEHDNNARFGIGVGDGTNKRNIAYGATTYKVNDTQVYNNRHVFIANSNGVYLDGVQVHGFESFTSTSTVYLFNLNISGGGNSAAGKIWSYKHKRNGILIRDFVPCLDKNNVPCMVDLVSGGTYYNQGTGSFSYGHTITPVEYLESTGTQFIDTGIANAYDIRLITSVSIEEANYGNDTIILGGRDQNTPGGGFCIRATGNSFDNDYYGTRVKIIDFSYNTWYEIDKNKNSCTINGTTVSNTQSTSIGTQTILLNGYTNNDGSKVVYQKGNVKWKFCKIYKNDVLVRSFIPVRDENNVGYMFDEVTGQLFGNAGSGSFGIGNDLTKPKVRFIQDVLPREYRPLKYLESTGTQYIDTGFKMSNDNMTFNGNMMWTQSQGNANFFFGYRSVNSAEYHGDMRAFFIYGASPAGRLAIRYGVNTDNSTSVAVSLNTKFNIAFDGTNLKVNDTTYATLTQAYTPANYKSIWLFNCNTTGYYSADVNHFIGRIYNWQIKQDGVPVRDFYPALRKSDNKPGMYDRITKQFFTNAATSGNDFNYG